MSRCVRRAQPKAKGQESGGLVQQGDYCYRTQTQAGERGKWVNNRLMDSERG